MQLCDLLERLTEEVPKGLELCPVEVWADTPPDGAAMDMVFRAIASITVEPDETWGHIIVIHC